VVLVLQDENTCIGCKQCVWHAPGCFRWVHVGGFGCTQRSSKACCPGSWPANHLCCRFAQLLCSIVQGPFRRGVQKSLCGLLPCRIEPDHGRSRVFAQWLNTEDDLQAAIGEAELLLLLRGVSSGSGAEQRGAGGVHVV